MKDAGIDLNEIIGQHTSVIELKTSLEQKINRARWKSVHIPKVLENIRLKLSPDRKTLYLVGKNWVEAISYDRAIDQDPWIQASGENLSSLLAQAHGDLKSASFINTPQLEKAILEPLIAYPHEIHIIIPRAMGGFGDIQHGIQLAQNLRRRFLPSTKIKVFFEFHEDYEKAASIHPDLSSETGTKTLDGIHYLSLEKIGAIEKPEGTVAIYTPIAADRKSAQFKIPFKDYKTNLYLTEYHLRKERLQLPQLIWELKGKDVITDSRGNTHALMRTGLRVDRDADPGLSSTGMMFLPEEAQKKPRSKEEIVARLRQKYPRLTPDFSNAKWGMVYYHDLYRRGRDYLEPLSAALHKRDTREEIVIFDLTTDTAAALRRAKVKGGIEDELESYRDQVARATREILNYTNVFFGEDGKEIVLKGARYPTVKIVHLSRIEHPLFLDIMRQCDLPILVTGDGSLAEAISLDKVFFYEDLPWKAFSDYDFRHLIFSLLSPEEAVELFGTLTDTRPEEWEDIFFTFEKLEALFPKLEKKARVFKKEYFLQLFEENLKASAQDPTEIEAAMNFLKSEGERAWARYSGKTVLEKFYKLVSEEKMEDPEIVKRVLSIKPLDYSISISVAMSAANDLQKAITEFFEKYKTIFMAVRAIRKEDYVATWNDDEVLAFFEKEIAALEIPDEETARVRRIFEKHFKSFMRIYYMISKNLKAPVINEETVTHLKEEILGKRNVDQRFLLFFDPKFQALFRKMFRLFKQRYDLTQNVIDRLLDLHPLPPVSVPHSNPAPHAIRPTDAHPLEKAA